MELVRRDVQEKIERAPIIDTHEHLCPPHFIVEGGSFLSPQIFSRSYVGFYDFFPGLKPEHQRYAYPVLAPTDTLLNFANFVYNYSNDYFRESLNRGFQRMYGISLDNWNYMKAVQLEKKIQEFYGGQKILEDSSFLKKKLQAYGNYKCAILDVPYGRFATRLPSGYQEQGDTFFRPALRLNSLLFAFDPECWTLDSDILHLSEMFSITPRNTMTFGTFVDALHAITEHAADHWVSLVLASAHERSLDFGPTPNPQQFGDMGANAAKIFNKSLKDVPWPEVLNFGNYVLREMLVTLSELPETRRIPVQVHTGTAIIQGSDPRKFFPLLEEFPDITFSLLHAGFPWWKNVFSALDMYSNVIVDADWLPLLSPVDTIQFFTQVIEKQLSRRVCAYGGDCACIEGSIGALESTKYCLGVALETNLRENTLHPQDLDSVIKDMFYDTPRKFFKLR